MKKLILNIVLFLGIALSVTAQNVYIPDANFKAYLVGRTDSINTNNDTVISVQEAEAFNGRISFGYSMGIKDITGIEKFINLTYLDCSSNQFLNLEISQNIKLTYLKCNVSGLKTLDVSKNINLTYLSCVQNSITNLDLSNNIKLVTLNCSSNKISNLNVSLNTNLKEINCDVNSITSLDLSKNINLTSITCYNNPLGTLDITNCINLDSLDCSYCTKLKFIDLRNNINLKYLNIGATNLKSLDLSNNTNLLFVEGYKIFNLKTICVSPSTNTSNWGDEIKYTTTYSTSCKNSQGDFPTNPKLVITNNIYLDTIINFSRAKNIVSACSTATVEENTIDAFYTFNADNSTTSLDLTVGNPAWLSTMELLDTLTFSPISNTCQSNVGVGQTTRTYNFTGLTVGQKYLVRLELGDVAPLGHARMEAVNNTFSVKLNSTVTDVSDNTISSNKTISNIYNLQGFEVSKDFRGLVIYKYTDGTTQKVVQE